MQLLNLREHDMAAVLDIQSCCYDAAKLESAPSFLAKLHASPASCFMAWLDDEPAGYLVAMPATVEAPPPLHAQVCVVPASADSLYLHDLAVHPRARGKGVAQALLGAFFEARQRSGLRYASLTAVNASSEFWVRQGFQPVQGSPALRQRLSSYGEGACYMCQDLGG